MIKFTIILPVYNSSSTINDTINSILNQTYENYELLIIDDGSTDNSVDLILKYNDKRIISCMVTGIRYLFTKRGLNKDIPKTRISGNRIIERQ